MGAGECRILTICRYFLGVTFKTDYFLGVYQNSRYFWGIVRTGVRTLC